MSLNIKPILNVNGEAKIELALANGGLGKISHIAIGRGLYHPTGTEVALVDEVARAPIETVVHQEQDGYVEITATITCPEDFTAGELAFLLEDGTPFSLHSEDPARQYPDLDPVTGEQRTNGDGSPKTRPGMALATLREGTEVPFRYVIDVNAYGPDKITVVAQPLNEAYGVIATRVAKLENLAEQFLTPEDFGAVGDGVVDDTVALQAAIDSGHSLLLSAPLGYRVTSRLLFRVDGASYLARAGSRLIFDGPITERLADATGEDLTFEDVVFDANQRQPRTGLVWVADDVVSPAFRRCRFQNILGNTYGLTVHNQTAGLLVSPYGVKNLTVEGCTFRDLIKVNDGSVDATGDGPNGETEGYGFISGILFMPEDCSEPVASQNTATNGRIDGNLFETINTVLAAGQDSNYYAKYSDADGIRTYAVTGGAERISVTITNNTFRAVGKRALKLRAVDTLARDNVIYASEGAYPMVRGVEANHRATVRDTRIHSTAALPIDAAVAVAPGEGVQTETLIDGLHVDHCRTLALYHTNPAGDPIINYKFRNLRANSATYAGILQSGAAPSNQDGIEIARVRLNGTGNAFRGLALSTDAAGHGGYRVEDVSIGNGTIDLPGTDIDVRDLTQTVTNPALIGNDAAAPLFRFGTNGFSGRSRLSDVTLDYRGLDATALAGARANLAAFYGDNAEMNGLRLLVPDAVPTTKPHAEFLGDDWELHAFLYDGAGRIHIGTTLAALRWAIKNATRKGGGGASSNFLYTSNAGTAFGLFENITDFRTGASPSIRINSGADFIVRGVASRSTATDVVQHGGLATVSGASTF